MDEHKDLINRIAGIAEEFKCIQQEAVRFYTDQVEAVIEGRISDERSIEAVMDGLLDFGDNQDCVELYVQLCRHVCRIYPEMAKEHVWMFRAFQSRSDDEADKSDDQNTPNLGSL